MHGDPGLLRLYPHGLPRSIGDQTCPMPWILGLAGPVGNDHNAVEDTASQPYVVFAQPPDNVLLLVALLFADEDFLICRCIAAKGTSNTNYASLGPERVRTSCASDAAKYASWQCGHVLPTRNPKTRARKKVRWRSVCEIFSTHELRRTRELESW